MHESTHSGAMSSESIWTRLHVTTTAFEACLRPPPVRPSRMDRSPAQSLAVVGWSSRIKCITWITRRRYTTGRSNVLSCSLLFGPGLGSVYIVNLVTNELLHLFRKSTAVIKYTWKRVGYQWEKGHMPSVYTYPSRRTTWPR